MYNIPIDRVCVFNCEAIGVINDAVGGVEVTIENDFTDESGEVLEPEFYKGNTLKLNGEQAVTFIRERDCSIFKSAMDRVERQEVPGWCGPWPKSLEESADFAWENEFNF